MARSSTLLPLMTHITKQFNDIGSQLAAINGTIVGLEASYNQLVEENTRLKLELDSMTTSHFSSHRSFVNSYTPEKDDESSVPAQAITTRSGPSTMDINEQQQSTDKFDGQPEEEAYQQQQTYHQGSVTHGGDGQLNHNLRDHEGSENGINNNDNNSQSNDSQFKKYNGIQAMAEKRAKVRLNKEMKVARLEKHREQKK
jgi:regulator of replication initiation timing